MDGWTHRDSIYCASIALRCKNALNQLQRYDWGKIVKMGHVTLTTPHLRVIFILMLELDIAYMCTV